jgi:hypothetical protein
MPKQGTESPDQQQYSWVAVFLGGSILGWLFVEVRSEFEGSVVNRGQMVLPRNHDSFLTSAPGAA